jgi:type I restriction enzyme, S subunit
MKTEKFSQLFFFHPKSGIQAGEGLNEGEYPFYTSSEKLSKRINNSQFNTRALIFGTGGKASIHFGEGRFSVSTDCLTVSSKQQNVNIKFVYYYLSGNIHILERGFKGAGLRHISRKFIEKLDIPLPPIATQNKIVTILDRAAALINKREFSIQLLDELLRSFFLDIFGDPVSNNRKWENELLGNIAILERGRFSPRPRNDPSYFNGKYPFIQTGDINNSNHRLNKYTQTLNEKGIKVSKQFNTGDIVIAIVGATIGATSILQINAYATDSIIAIKSKNKTNNVFLEMLLRFYRQVLLDKAPDAARANINLSILRKLKIITPPMDLQTKYLNIDRDLEEQKGMLIYSLNQLTNLFKSIIQKAYSGELNFDIDVELDTLIQEINLQNQDNDLLAISGDIAYLQRLVDKLNDKEFTEREMYDKAKHVAFKLLKENVKLTQIYNEDTKSIKLELK